MKFIGPAQILPLFLLSAHATAGELPIQHGAYEITARLILPHLEQWAVDSTKIVCAGDGGAIPVPVLSANNPFKHCAATGIRSSGDSLSYDIACAGRGAANAHAAYSVTPGGFVGSIDMVLGGKNMTMTEVQRARRVGECRSSTAQAD
jgi:hypothetical protein